jgi:cytochrome c peroxidase
MKNLFVVSVSLLLLVLGGCHFNYDNVFTDGTLLDEELTRSLEAASGGIGPAYFRMPASDDYAKLPQDPLNPLTGEKVMLGKLLYHETGLAVKPKIALSMNTYSCASCHAAQAGFQACKKQGIAEGGLGFGDRGEGRRPNPDYPVDSLDIQPLRTPSVLNTAYQEVLLWNGQFGATGLNAGTEYAWTAGSPKEVNFMGFQGLESQAIAGLKVHRMEIDEGLLNSTDYKKLFDLAFPEVPQSDRYTRKQAGLAIAAYERTILANEAPFQRWLHGEKEVMTEGQKAGAVLFFGKAGCAGCHSGPGLNNMAFYAIGMKDLGGPGIYGTPSDDPAHLGRGSFTGQAEDMFKFKVPQLYNLKDSPFYGHGGSYTDLYELIQYKNEGKPENPKVPQSQLASEFNPLGLSEMEVKQIVDFLQNGLYDPGLMRYEPGAILSGNCFPNNDIISRIDLGCN